MKMKFIFIGLFLCFIIILTIILNYKFGVCYKKIENIDRLRFSYTDGYAINSYASYVLTCDLECTATVKPVGVSEEDFLSYNVSSDTIKKIEDLLNDNNVSNWNGFKKSDKYVLDGDSFSFSLHMSNGKSIEASGYMKWPKNYNEVKSRLDSIFLNLGDDVISK